MLEINLIKCVGVWCPVCNQGFTRHYNLKVHMYKSHGKEYLENNFSQEELDAIMRPPPGSNTSKPSPTPRKRSDEEIVIPGTPTGVLPISPPLTPKLSPKQKLRNDDSPTMVPSNSVIPSANILKANLQRSNRPGPASLTKPQHYFDQEAQHSMLKCQLCEEKFLRKSDLFIHLQQHGVNVLNCQDRLCEDRFVDVDDLKRHMTSTHGQSQSSNDSAPVRMRKPGPASRTNAPKENRACNNLPGHLASQCQETTNGFPCHQCGKVLMHKQSYVSHMRVIHGDYYGGNKWQGSSVVEMVLGGQKNGIKKESSPINYSQTADQDRLDENIQSKHPNLTKRIQAFRATLGLNDSDEPDSKRIKLDYQGRILKDQNENSLPSYSIFSFSAAPAQLSRSNGYDEPLDLACKPVSLNVDIEDDEDEHFAALQDSNNNPNHSNNLLQIARPQQPSSPCSPLNLHISRPATPNQPINPCLPSPTQYPSQPSQPSLLGASQPSQTPPTQPSHYATPLPQPPAVNPTAVNPNTAAPSEQVAQNTTQVSGPDASGAASSQPKLHEYLVKQSNATSDEQGRKKFLCPVCKCQLSWKTNLSVHLRTHSGERPFQCVLCLNRFRQKAHLYKHFRCSHGHKVAPYKCMFCPETFTRSPNDLYNHITEVHKRETDALTNNNNNNNVKDDEKLESKEDLDEDKVEDLSKPKISQETLDESVEEEEMDDFEPRDRDDDVRFEAIQEEFQFDGKVIRPSYCVLPFVTDDEVEACTRRNIAVSPFKNVSPTIKKIISSTKMIKIHY